MRKVFLTFLLIVFSFQFLVFGVSAADTNYATFVVPVRGREFWRINKELKSLINIIELVQKYKISTTYLLQYDTLWDDQVIKSLPAESEKGIFLEITPKLALASFVNYPWETEKWERADKLFLSGYEISDRQKLIDKVMEKFKNEFGFYPKSVGAWHIDSWSLEYLRNRYNTEAVLGLADQYTTDGYQMWGQYLGLPYYPSRGSPIEPAANSEDKIDVVKMAWASRHPYLGLLGKGIETSNYSVQVNDYYRFHKLDRKYIEDLLKIYTVNVLGKLSQITLGIEAGELEDQYRQGLIEQLETIRFLGLSTVTMSEFAKEYKKTFPNISPEIIIQTPEITWISNSNQRIGKLKDSTIVDQRYFHTSCYKDDDTHVADKRQNLYRVVISSNLKKCTKYFEPKVSVRDKLRIFFGKLIPDFRVSKLDGKWVFGLRTGPEKLNFKYYKFPILEAFLSLDKFRHPKVKIYARWEDQLVNAGFDLVKSRIKSTDYGVNNLNDELKNKIIFENSMYVVE